MRPLSIGGVKPPRWSEPVASIPTRTEAPVGGAGRSGGHSGGGIVPTARWGARLISGESLEGAEVGIEVLDPLVAAIGLIVAAVVVVFLLTPPKLRGSIGRSNAFSNSNLLVAAVVGLAKSAGAGAEFAEVNVGDLGLAEVAP